ncbi:MAG TPA: alpha/beta hydrolase [Nevskiaceae bacterium]|nr:alpha/beta hydrolase [Nevskiaceae bacterium]
MRFALTSLLLLLAALSGCTSNQMLNSTTPTRGYKVASNLVYDPAYSLRLDVYTPDDARNAPVVVFFHGGRWSGGSKDFFRFVGEALTSRGFVAVVTDFRQYPQVRFPGFVEDGAKAVVWTRQNISTYGGDPNRLFVMGHSSGAHIAAMLAVKDSFLTAAGGSRTWLRGMIGLAGPYDFLPIEDPELRDVFAPPEKFAETQPILWADGTNPPLLLMHGEDDETVWVKNTRSFASAVAKAGGPVDTVIYPKMSHERMLQSLSKALRAQTDVIDHIAGFVKKWSAQAYVPPNRTEESIQTVPVELE